MKTYIVEATETRYVTLRMMVTAKNEAEAKRKAKACETDDISDTNVDYGGIEVTDINEITDSHQQETDNEDLPSLYS